MRKVYKMPTSAFSLFVDIPLLILFTQNFHRDIISIYIHLRVMMIYLAPLILLFKLVKNCFLIARKSGFLNHILSILHSEKDLGDLYKFARGLAGIYLFIAEHFLLISCFMYSITNAQGIFTSSNLLILFLTIISLTILLSFIEIYISKRYNQMIDVFKNRAQEGNI